MKSILELLLLCSISTTHMKLILELLLLCSISTAHMKLLLDFWNCFMICVLAKLKFTKKKTSFVIPKICFMQYLCQGIMLQ